MSELHKLFVAHMQFLLAVDCTFGLHSSFRFVDLCSFNMCKIESSQKVKQKLDDMVPQNHTENLELKLLLYL